MKTRKLSTLALVSWIAIGSLFAFLAVTSQNASAQSIAVTNPSSGSVWYKDDPYTILWTSTPTVGPNVKIEIDYQGHASPTTIDATTPNDGSYVWIVSCSLAARSDYFIRISDASNLSEFDDSDMFQIAGNCIGDITVTSPSILDVWETGSTHSITWTTVGNVGPNVKIDYECVALCGDGVVVASTPTVAGSYSWTLPTSMTANQYYNVRVSDASNANVYDDSGVFYVKPGAALVDALLVGVVALVIIVVLIIIVAVVLMASRRKAATMPPPQANIPGYVPPGQYAPPQAPSPPMYAPPQMYQQPQGAQQPPVSGPMKVCRNCGRSVQADFTFCIHCGGRT